MHPAFQIKATTSAPPLIHTSQDEIESQPETVPAELPQPEAVIAELPQPQAPLADLPQTQAPLEELPQPQAPPAELPQPQAPFAGLPQPSAPFLNSFSSINTRFDDSSNETPPPSAPEQPSLAQVEISNIETLSPASPQAGPNSISVEALNALQPVELPPQPTQEVQTNPQQEPASQTVAESDEQQSSNDAPQAQNPEPNESDASQMEFEIPVPQVPLGPRLQVPTAAVSPLSQVEQQPLPEQNPATLAPSQPSQFEQAFELQSNSAIVSQASADPLSNEQPAPENEPQENQQPISDSQQQILSNVVSQSINAQPAEADPNQFLASAPEADAALQSVAQENLQPESIESAAIQDRLQSDEETPSAGVEATALSLEIPKSTLEPGPFTSQPQSGATAAPVLSLAPEAAVANADSVAQGYTYNAPSK